MILFRTETQATRYTIAVCKGSAYLEETKALLRAWQPGESATEFRDRVLREDLLGRMTAYRASDIVRRVFAWRFLRPDDKPALLLKRLLEGGQSGQVFSDLCFLYAVRNDDLIRDVVTQLYWPSLSEGRLILSPAYVVEFLRQADRDGRIPEPWSEQVKLRVARGVLKAMTDFGLLREVGRGKRELVHFRPADRTIVYLVHDIHFSGSTDARIIEHKDWALFGFRARDVASALDRLSGQGWWLAQIAGSLIRVTWKHTCMEEVVDAIAR
jgi:BrxA